MEGRQSEKRRSDADERDDLQLRPKRAKIPTLESAVFGISKMEYLQRLIGPSLEPMLRRVVYEEVERALKNGGLAGIGERYVPRQIEGPNGRNLQLHFKTKLSLPIFTGGNVGGENGVAIQVLLRDANTGLVVTSGPEACSKLDVLVLDGDFNYEDGDSWIEEAFNTHKVKQREGKRPLLIGDLQVTLKDGIGTLGELSFTDNSSWVRSKMFRLGVRIASGYNNGIRIREATTDAFRVKDHRGEEYKKRHPPSLKDKVWRLEKIGKNGQFHKRLSENDIYTVEHFLENYNQSPQQLRKILGSGMSDRMWESLVAHAKTCVLGDMRYAYYPDGTSNQVPQMHLQSSLFSNQYSVEMGKAVGAGPMPSPYDGIQAIRYAHLPHDEGSHAPMLISRASIEPQEKPADSTFQTQFMASDSAYLGFHIPDPIGQSVAHPGLQMLNSFNMDAPFEDEIHLWNLGNEDLFSIYNMGVASTSSQHDDLYGFSYMSPLFHFSEFDNGGSRASNKATVGWLKMKAAMRWGIFIRKRAAEKRRVARLVEV
ncbi:calmodulin-binding protein 60 C-like isoform X1 [Zingiber officinale]|uniref:calmodulin-binding protein 60 C-like isoform X1 n=1 Tax=Zingiber officinale TaxID=94328 RepID=UPI001C4A798B|nr:calmodulin-binding protein 60 C-like isoform X1 [Zingiber officinale]XP_042403853.1 calmodulin-binding protein 60 C-like isoform X1 [Zingiber officinale]XP_042403854.1 calmodulin-binding protein 60 C-like isoform X1 [Zingiber officinale]